MTKARTFEETHPWLTFQLSLLEATPELWLLLGEAQSKALHLSAVPMLPEVRNRLQMVSLARGVQATTAIEGNTLSDEQVEQEIRGELKVPPSQEYLRTEVANIVRAYNVVHENIHAKEKWAPDFEFLLWSNGEVLKDLELEDEVVRGTLRTHEVSVGRYRGAPAQDLDFLTNALCDWLNEDWNLPDGYSLASSFLKAIMGHIYIAWIHPFGDGNGRVARLLEFSLLIASGVPATTAHLLSNHYNKTRQQYYLELSNASKKHGGDPIPFIRYALRGLIDGLRGQIDLVKTQQLDVHWRNYVHSKFNSEPSSPAQKRRRLLALAISNRNYLGPSWFDMKGWVSIERLRSDHRLNEMYMGKHARTFTRDLNVLVEMELIERRPGAVRPLREIMMSFAPMQVGDARH